MPEALALGLLGITSAWPSFEAGICSYVHIHIIYVYGN